MRAPPEPFRLRVQPPKSGGVISTIVLIGRNCTQGDDTKKEKLTASFWAGGVENTFLGAILLLCSDSEKLQCWYKKGWPHSSKTCLKHEVFPSDLGSLQNFLVLPL